MEIYNEPGKLAWDNAGKPQKNGQRSLGQADVPAQEDGAGEED